MSTTLERFLEDVSYRKNFPEDLIPERTEWEDLASWLNTAEDAALDLLSENEELKSQLEQLKSQLEQLKCCANCKHSTEGDCDCFENCSSCNAMYCVCELKSTKHNIVTRDWDYKCDNWESAE